MTNKSNSQESGVIVGFLLGFGAFLAYDVLRDSDKREKVKKDVKKIAKDLSPYIKELKKRIEESEKLQDAVKSVDKKFGTQLYTYLMNDVTTIKLDEKNKPKKKIQKKRGFFKLK